MCCRAFGPVLGATVPTLLGARLLGRTQDSSYSFGHLTLRVCFWHLCCFGTTSYPPTGYSIGIWRGYRFVSRHHMAMRPLRDASHFGAPSLRSFLASLLAVALLLAPCADVAVPGPTIPARSEEHTSELQSLRHLVCRLLLEKKKKKTNQYFYPKKKKTKKKKLK